MKHNVKVTLTLILLFLVAHVIGLLVTQHYLPEESQLPLNIQKPQLEEKTSFITIFISILIATGIALILIKLGALKIWKFWFFISVLFTLTISLSAFIPVTIAVISALILAIFKVYRPNLYIHNLTEVFIYGAIAAIFVPVLNLFSVTILLILISIYDMIAVWRTKHMVSMAKFQTKAKMFTGLLINYGIPQAKPQSTLTTSKSISKNIQTKTVKVHVQQAILGGGDIAFPLLFSGVILKSYGFLPAMTISFFAALALLVLFMLAEKKKFYPAMPFVTIGCFVGYLVVRILF